MNAGARSSQSPFLIFLHSDTRLPEHADTQVMTHLARSETSWGRFDVRIDGRSRLLPIVGAMMNLRSRLTGIATGAALAGARPVIHYQISSLIFPAFDQLVNQAAKLPLGTSPEWMHETYGFALAVLTFAIVFGAFAANVLFGGMRAVPRAQLETAEAYGMSRRQTFWRILVPQMWVYALPGLSNLWMVLIKATPLLFLLGVEDIVYWARDLGGAKTPRFTDYPHPDWRMWYFLALLVFYLGFTKVWKVVLGRVMHRLTKGQATAGGEAQRKAAA